MSGSTACWLFVAITLAGAVTLAATPPAAYTAMPEGGPGIICYDQTSSSFRVMESWLTPPDDATVTAGTPVTFSTRSEAPVTFVVASSPALISSPDIDSGTATRVPFSEEPGPQTSFTYTYTSAVAANTPGTVYWQASISSADIEPCAGLTPVIWRTGVYSLHVLPAPVQVSIDSPYAFRSADPTVTYQVDCSIDCTGDTYYEASELQRTLTARRVPSLDLGPTAVSITAATGGS